jgi:hypothetical protein
MRTSEITNLICTLAAAVLCSALAGCQTAAYPPAANPPAQAEAPRLAVGDRWVYSHTDAYTKLPRGVFTHTITAIDGNTVSVQVSNDAGNVVATHQFTRDWNWLDKPLTNLQRFRYSPPYRAFAFPLKPGAEWSVQMQITDMADLKTYNLAQVSGKALDWQRVSVPAGNFDAVRVERIAYSGVNNQWRNQETIRESDWYAPAVNNIVAGSYRSEYRDLTMLGDDSPGWTENDWTLIELLQYLPVAQKP